MLTAERTDQAGHEPPSHRHGRKCVALSRISVVMVNGEMEYEERCKVLADFEHRRIQVIAVPCVLDEGIDIPEADLGLIIAGSASRRQLIQRLGRVIRKRSDGIVARICLHFVEGTREDPE